MENKFCKGCKIVLPISCFAKTKNVKDGYENKCRECRKEQRRKFNEKPCVKCGSIIRSTNNNTRFCTLECSGQSRRLNHIFVKKQFKVISDLNLMSQYKGNKIKVSVECNKCNYLFSVQPDNVLTRKSGCPKCYGNILKTTEDFSREVTEITDGEYELKSNYNGNKTLVTIRHNLCKSEYKVTPHKFVTGRRCPVCNSSHGEMKIRKYLLENDIEFEQEFKFDDCRRVRPLPFDFAIFNQGKLVMLIEYDGEQHFKQSFPENNRSTLEYVQTNDRIKSEYCKQNNISLLRIPYYNKENIPNILNNIFTMKIPSQA